MARSRRKACPGEVPENRISPTKAGGDVDDGNEWKDEEVEETGAWAGANRRGGSSTPSSASMTVVCARNLFLRAMISGTVAFGGAIMCAEAMRSSYRPSKGDGDGDGEGDGLSW